MMKKEEKYKTVLETIELLIKDEDDVISVMSTIACELYHAFEHFNWVGFYRLVDEKILKVGPYQGKHGCLSIPIDQGVCDKCARKNRVQIENDVRQIPYHMACSGETNSEIVIPARDKKGKVKAVLDIDSTEINSLDEIDENQLKIICEKIYPDKQ
ncbi:GAF domain-containing protein [bacterium]|nr:GAF domain-containing protein [bacterium]RQV95550.1 MAG: GAF domain-containing protein [bacterium]